ncbi:hypothetical protein HXZ77_02115 [Acinetobacter johnsonii]|uniref:hypothetical protein n=1 Tax=Acinetobacter johnsonii TaxID=40214 RepID=UPI002574D2C4|nr:hypothetical protein [Acinetobacter johnsonii]MDM1249950.1 hypothetical protein [Acinetobacter johnsonii]
MFNNKLLLVAAIALLAGCTSKQEKACQEEADVAETVMQARLNYGGFAEVTYMLAGDNDELREQLRPIIHDAFEYGRGGTATYEKTKQVFRDKYYQQCMERPAP